MRIKTNPSALVSATVIAGVLTLTIMGNGRQSTTGGTLDSFALEALRGGLSYLAAFAAGHYLLRRFNVGSRWAYAGIGAVAALIAMSATAPLWAWSNIVHNGTISLFVGVTAATGAILGFIYNWRAGLEADSDDPAVLPTALAARMAELQPADRIKPDWGLIDGPVSAGNDEYFAGPLQVRTSMPIAFVAALTSAGLLGLASYVMGVSHEMIMRLNAPAPLPLSQALGLAANSQLLVLLITGMVAPIPFAILTLLGHLAARGLKKQSYLAYGLIGLCAPIMLVILAGPLGLIYGLPSVLPMVLALCLYRNMAGLEPVPVKEDIFVRERRDLVGENHPRRQFGRLVKS